MYVEVECKNERQKGRAIYIKGTKECRYIFENKEGAG